MRSTFMGLETARRGMFTQQSALYTTGHNISNSNTPGYSRQRINFVQTEPYPSIGMNSPYLPGQMGTGVEAGSVQRIRESFLDLQYRGENNKMGYYGSLSESLTKMEEIMNEPSKEGLQNTLSEFWKSLQGLANHTENSGTRDVVASSGIMVADALNYYYNSLSRVQTDLGQQIGVKEKEINTTLSAIEELNRQIAAVEPHGYLPNDLYDQRDLLIDQLSKMVSIKVTNVIPDNYGNPKKMAEGLVNIEIVKEDGTSYGPPSVNLISVDGKTGTVSKNELTVDYDSTSKMVNSVTINGKPPTPSTQLTDFSFSGELIGLIKSYGYKDSTGTKGYYPDMLANLNKMTKAFADEFNEIHQEGYALGETKLNKKDRKFFEFEETNPAQSIKVRSEIMNNPDLIAAGDGNGDSANNKNAQRLAYIKTKPFSEYKNPPAGLTGNLDTYYAGIIGKLGVDSRSAQKNLKSSQVLLDSVEFNRQSVSGVDIDEELTNMIKFQHAYNASARNITVIDEMLDKIINGMGTVGR